MTSAQQPDLPREANGNAEEADRARRPKRAQVSKACQRCKRLQKGCSEFRPCQRCVKVGLGEQCVSSEAQAHQPDPAAAWSFTRLPTSPQSYVSGPLESFQRQAELLPSPVIEHCCRKFFSELYPTIPILTPEFVGGLSVVAESRDEGSEAHCIIAAMCAMVLLQVEQPDAQSFETIIAHNNAMYGKLVFDEALAAYHHLSQRLVPTLERVLSAFFLYACHAVQFHHSQAFFFLREATTLFLLMRTDEDDVTRKNLIERLFWVLLVSERSHAIRYRRPVTLQINSSSPEPHNDVQLSGLWSLVALFRPLDTSFIALLNQESVVFPPTQSSLTYIETAISTALDRVIGLQDTQIANLRTTQLWLQIIIWQVRLRLGFLTEQSDIPSLTYHYPLDVASRLVDSARAMPINSLRVHGVGLTEKLFDVACAVVDVLARIPVGRLAQQYVSNRPEDDLHYLRLLISELPGGKSIYNSLLDKHMQQTLPSLVLDSPDGR